MNQKIVNLEFAIYDTRGSFNNNKHSIGNSASYIMYRLDGLKNNLWLIVIVFVKV